MIGKQVRDAEAPYYLHHSKDTWDRQGQQEDIPHVHESEGFRRQVRIEVC